MTSEQAVPRPTRGRSLMIVGSVMAGVGLVVAVVSGTLIAKSVGGPLVSAFTSPARTTPVKVSLSLDSGRYTVFERTGTTDTKGPITSTNNHPTTVTADDVTVTGPDGKTVPTSSLTSASETLTREDTIYTGAVRFRVPVSGEYQVQVDGPADTEVVIAPAFGTGFRAVLPWVGIGALSVLAMVVGTIVLVIGQFRRRSARREAQAQQARSQQGQAHQGQSHQHLPTHGQSAPASGPPAGWYPAPDTAGRQRYWDGKNWTDRLQ